MGDPRWYQSLSREGRDRVDQTLHVALGFVLALIGSAALAWGFFHWREFVQQAPIERIEDTRRDMRFGVYGAVAGQVVFTAWTTWVVLAIRG